jgi:peptidoglycan/xylan/chitin deacetylase (PgdA/CDA1 family)
MTPECLCAMDIFVLSSLSEGFSNAILEAMAAKIPVIATNVGGNSESVISGETGLLVPPADSNSLGNAIVTLLKNKKLARQMGESGLEMAEAKFQLKRMISENEETYDYVLRKKRRSIEGSADKLSDYRWLFHQGAKVAVASIFYYSGIIKIYVKIKRILGYSTIKILTYHNISDDYPDFLGICHTVDSFKKQINFLKDNYNIKTLEDSITCLKEPKHYEDITVITFDDAYKEFIDVVIPILGRDNLPATFFLSVDPIQSGIPLTIDLIICAMAITSKKEMDFRKYGLKKYFFDSNNKKEKVILSINKHFKRITSEERNEIVEDIFKILKVEKNEIEKLHKVLDWDDVRNMRRDGISIGSHTLGHPNLASIPLSDADNEIKRSKSILEEKTGLQIDYFSYPYGGYDNFNRQVSELVKESNYQGAVTLVPDSGKELDEFLIPRLSISKGMCMGPFNNFSESLMAAEICGISKYIFLRFLKSDDMDA